jgi:3-hydroxyacyl-CoA dehydrogenase/enoyl-CoA hydratase/3-hydroxybutyryl-CoA epimerase
MLRLPERIGPQAALDMMLSGKTVDAQKARRLGLADDCVPPRVMDQRGSQCSCSANQPRRRPPLLQRPAQRPAQGPAGAWRARKQVARRARAEHYPAPYAIIDIWARHHGNALAAPQLIDSIVRSPTARNLVRVFFLQERLKNLGKGGTFLAKRVHVVGAGVMGGDIAAWCARRGLTVTLQDQGMERIAPALQRAYTAWGKRISGRARAARRHGSPDSRSRRSRRPPGRRGDRGQSSRISPPSRPCSPGLKPSSGRMRCWQATLPACASKICARFWPGPSA